MSTGNRMASQFRVYGEVRNHAIPGRPRISSWRVDIHLIREVRNHPFLTVSELKVKSNVLGSTQTARRHLRSYGIKARRAAPKLSLTDAQIVDCLTFISSQEGFNWRYVVLCDEVTILSSSNGPVLVCRKDGF